MHLGDKEAGAGEYTGITFPDKETAEEYTRNLENAEDDMYDLDYQAQERGMNGTHNKM